jgi:hypothetical protein
MSGSNNSSNAEYATILGGCGNTANQNYAGVYGCGITTVMACAFHVNRIVLTNVPTASAGLPSGAVWSDAGTLKIVP